MKRAGIGSVVILEVNVGIPRGHVDFLSTEWKDCFKHAVDECERLGISMIPLEKPLPKPSYFGGVRLLRN